MPEPVPCPWCGSEVHVGDGPREKFRVWCMALSCSAAGPLSANREEAIAAWNRVAEAVAALLDELERLRAEPFWIRIPPYKSLKGSLCGLCDGTYEHSHPQVKCSRCGREGLQENWPFDCCGTDPHA